MILEGFCLAFFIVRVIHGLYFSVPSVFWRDTKNIMVIGIITVSMIKGFSYSTCTCKQKQISYMLNHYIPR